MRVCTDAQFQLLNLSELSLIHKRFLIESLKDIKYRSAILVYFVLLTLMDTQNKRDKSVSISLNQIAKQINATSRTATRAIQYLKREGYIEVVARMGQHQGFLPNKLKIRFPIHLLKKVLEPKEPKPSGAQVFDFMYERKEQYDVQDSASTMV